MSRSHIAKWMMLALCFFVVRASGQPLKTINIQTENFSLDLMGNIYWTNNQSLIKHRTETGDRFEYTQNFLGPVHSYDVSNPLKILVFHKSLNQIVFLDKNLSSISSPISLDEMGIAAAGACCMSYNGGFWVLNTPVNQIQHYNTNLQLTKETPVVNELGNLQNISPQLIEKNQRLYCHLPGCCTLVFDRFGNPAGRYPLKNVNNIQIVNGNIYYFYKDKLHQLNGNGHTNQTVPLPEKSGHWENGKIGERNRLYLIKDQKLYIYRHQR